jgi:hypothetical protein
MMDRRPTVGRRRSGDIDQSMIELGQAKAKIADLTRRMAGCLALVDSAKKPGEYQRSDKTDRAKPSAQGRSVHSVDPAPSCVRVEPTVFVTSRQPHRAGWVQPSARFCRVEPVRGQENKPWLQIRFAHLRIVAAQH